MNVLHTRWRALVLALLLAVSLAVPAAAAEPQAAAADLQTTADTAAAYAAQYGGAQSLQYALWQDGEIVLTGQTGTFSRSENRLMTGDELYGIGSVSKIYTTVAVMQLAEDGKVSLDAPVTRYLPDFKMADERYKDITVRMLLNHSSGILGTGLSDAMLFGEASTRAHDTLLEKLSTQRLAADPGSFSVYCNDGFTLRSWWWRPSLTWTSWTMWTNISWPLWTWTAPLLPAGILTPTIWPPSTGAPTPAPCPRMP